MGETRSSWSLHAEDYAAEDYAVEDYAAEDYAAEDYAAVGKPKRTPWLALRPPGASWHAAVHRIIKALALKHRNLCRLRQPCQRLG